MSPPEYKILEDLLVKHKDELDNRIGDHRTAVLRHHDLQMQVHVASTLGSQVIHVAGPLLSDEERSDARHQLSTSDNDEDEAEVDAADVPMRRRNLRVVGKSMGEAIAPLAAEEVSGVIAIGGADAPLAAQEVSTAPLAAAEVSGVIAIDGADAAETRADAPGLLSLCPLPDARGDPDAAETRADAGADAGEPPNAQSKVIFDWVDGVLEKRPVSEEENEQKKLEKDGADAPETPEKLTRLAAGEVSGVIAIDELKLPA